jgi:hypothetical protein
MIRFKIKKKREWREQIKKNPVTQRKVINGDRNGQHDPSKGK